MKKALVISISALVNFIESKSQKIWNFGVGHSIIGFAIQWNEL